MKKKQTEILLRRSGVLHDRDYPYAFSVKSVRSFARRVRSFVIREQKVRRDIHRPLRIASLRSSSSSSDCLPVERHPDPARSRTVTRAKPQLRTRIVAMTIIQYFAALLAMGALLAYFVRARIERARRDAPPLALIFRSLDAAWRVAPASRPTFVRAPRDRARTR